MLTSLALIFLLGLALGKFFQQLRLPSLLGMLITGIVLGPYALNLLDGSILGISADLRRLALVIILTRAGLALKLDDLRRVGRPALLMCFVPALFEIGAITLLAPALLGVSRIDAAVMGTVVAAVSPAVIVPRMLMLMEDGHGTDQSIPQMIMASASVDDVFVIVLFTSFTGLAQGASISAGTLIGVPISIVTGLLIGILSGLMLSFLFLRVHMRDSVKVLILLSVSFLLIALEDALAGIIPLSGLLAVMSMGGAVLFSHAKAAVRLSAKFSRLWVGAEILLFVLVGAEVDMRYAISAGLSAAVLILCALAVRAGGVLLCLLGTRLTLRERLFCVLAYMPKATVQAAIGAIPLAMGLAGGQMILTVAVLAILITAPLGALGIDLTYKRLLKPKQQPNT